MDTSTGQRKFGWIILEQKQRRPCLNFVHFVLLLKIDAINDILWAITQKIKIAFNFYYCEGKGKSQVNQKYILVIFLQWKIYNQLNTLNDI